MIPDCNADVQAMRSFFSTCVLLLVLWTVYGDPDPQTMPGTQSTSGTASGTAANGQTGGANTPPVNPPTGVATNNPPIAGNMNNPPPVNPPTGTATNNPPIPATNGMASPTPIPTCGPRPTTPCPVFSNYLCYRGNWNCIRKCHLRVAYCFPFCYCLPS
eukprot:GILK01026657.1.p1 GENE.GILK01026657.1~~GILK01026657.1.p1  ORF type:complete len:159 (-),score=8.98 GILK01026657.1:12-488(-)